MDYRLKVKEKIKRAPKTPGVYVFYDRKNILYIGKASNLKNRLRSYLKAGDFNPAPFDIYSRKSIPIKNKERVSQSKRCGVKNARLQENATNLKFIHLRSEIEALIEEAKLIKKYNPLYNVLWRDDKTYFYALFAGDKFPRIFVVHKNRLPTTNHSLPTINAIGPFTDGRALRLVLRMLRRYFPYCTCPKPHLRICLNAQIGNCFGFCCIARRSVSAKESRNDGKATTLQIAQYKKNIRIIKNFLVGKPIKGFAKNLKPEEKSALEKILAHREFLETQTNTDYTRTNTDENWKGRSKSVFSPLKSVSVECYDISHLSGKETVAGMTSWSFENGKLLPRKDFWRKFIIRTAKSGDDPAAMYEAVSRRLNHPEWPYPNLMVIDGGAGQFAAAQKALRLRSFDTTKDKLGQAAADSGLAAKIKIISFAKPESMVYGLKEFPIKINDAPADMQKIIPAAISGTHDFAIRFHRQRRKKNFLNSAGL